MSRFIVLSVVVASLSALVGCSASSNTTRHAATPAGVNVADVRDDASWAAPEDGFEIKEAQAPRISPLRARERLEGSYRPNREERPARGAIHPATY